MLGYLRKFGLFLLLMAVIIVGFFGIKKFYYEPLRQEQQQKKTDKKKKLEEQKRKRAEALKKAQEETNKNKSSNQSPIDALKEMFAPSKEPPPYAYHAPATINERLGDYYFAEEILSWYNKALANPSKENNALFFGSPGTGKTSIARILAKHTNKPFFEVKGDDLYAQQHEKREPRDKVLALIADIEQKKFAGLKGDNKDIDISQGYILFIDEANSMEKESVSRGRKLGFLKTIYDAFDKHQENKKVLTILATNYLEDLDRGLYREGRFAKLGFNFSLPLVWRIIEKEGIDYDVFLLSNLPRISTVGKRSSQLIAKFGIGTLRKFMKFWAKGQLSRKFSQEEKKFRHQFRKTLELFWELEEGQLEAYLRQTGTPTPPWEQADSDSEKEEKKKKGK